MTKKSYSFHALVLLICFSLVSATTFAAGQKPAQPTLLISVSVPPVWDPMRESDVADAFYSRITTALERAGYTGRISSADRFDTPAPETPVLEITVIRWRPERSGNVECAFSAGLKTGTVNQSLGLFTGTSLQWMTTASRTWELRRGMDDSADDAVRDLVSRLRKNNLLLPAEKPAAD
jgi:hypothetical protein